MIAIVREFNIKAYRLLCYTEITLLDIMLVIIYLNTDVFHHYYHFVVNFVATGAIVIVTSTTTTCSIRSNSTIITTSITGMTMMMTTINIMNSPLKA